MSSQVMSAPTSSGLSLRGLGGAALMAFVLEAAILAAAIYHLSQAAPKKPPEPAPVMLSFPALTTPLPTPAPVTPPVQPTPPVQSPPTPIPVQPPPVPQPAPIPQPAPPPPPPPPKIKPVVKHEPPPKPPKLALKEVHKKEAKTEHKIIPAPVEPVPLDSPTSMPVPPAPAPAPAPAPPAPAVSAQVTMAFEAQVRSAVQSALVYPAAARMMHLSGRTKVAFIYQDGQTSGLRVIDSSGSALLDNAALAAVRAAHYPEPAAAQRHKPLSFELWVQFTQSDSDS